MIGYRMQRRRRIARAPLRAAAGGAAEESQL